TNQRGATIVKSDEAPEPGWGFAAKAVYVDTLKAELTEAGRTPSRLGKATGIKDRNARPLFRLLIERGIVADRSKGGGYALLVSEPAELPDRLGALWDERPTGPVVHSGE